MARDTQLWIMVDIETSGPVIAIHSMTELSWFQAKGKRFDVELPHVAVKDAEIQIRHFFGELQ